ncbi:MAG: DUF6079 family protein [Fimbriimonadaceae bacterium]|nr:DUF6079 family protein [Fimbriimonadaceae bacterium]NUM38593.1 hypothetical protein [Armatimonadota bacterium]
MKYGDLFELNEITEVIKIAKADTASGAQELVKRFVLTKSLSDSIDGIAIPQLNFESGVEGKGIFVVGNYGTGKSHVMSFLSILAENADMLRYVQDDEWRAKLAAFAGKYVVIRQEIAVSDKSVTLFSIVCNSLEELASKNGFEFKFRREGVDNIKKEFARFMAAFEGVHPNKGALLVIDEVLDYLRFRDSSDRVGDLSTLRSIGEFCDESRLRIMAGVQQSLFDNPEFAGFAEQLTRIRKRYNDFNIDKKGVSELIEQYLFKKTESQKDTIRKLISARSKYYEVIGAELENFVSLFPAHPLFIDEFQRVMVVERREILTILSKEAKRIKDKAVNEEAPDLITSDKYWKHIESDQGLKANPNVARVVDNVKTIKAKVNAHFGANEDKASAERLVEALGVSRLTTPDVTTPVGLTPLALKDSLLWWTKLPPGVGDSAFLADAAKRLLVKTREAANGQYLAVSESSGQWYIDPTRDRDYEQEVNAFNPGKNDVQRHLNEILGIALELDNAQKAPQGTIWNYAITWEDKKVERPGWLFFGFPSERSTAKPPLDFYIFIMPSKRITEKEDAMPNVPDESYVTLEDFPLSRFEKGKEAKQDDPDTFLDLLRKYTSASLRADVCPVGSNDRVAFEGIAKKLRGMLAEEFRENAGEWLSITHGGNKKRFREWIQTIDPTKANFPLKSQFDSVAQGMFKARFETEYPDYPSFDVKVSESSRPGACQSAIEIVCQRFQGSKEGWAVLEALGLAHGNALTLEKSDWLKKARNLLKGKGDGQVLNHSDLFEKRKDDKWWFKGECIEAEFLNVVIAAGVYAGDFIITTSKNEQVDAANLQAKYEEIRNFQNVKRLSRPAEPNLELWRKLMELFGVNAALIASEKTKEEGILKFQTEVQKQIQRLAEAEGDKSLLPFSTDETADAIAGHAQILGAVKGVLEGNLTPLNTKAKMRNLNLDVATIDKLVEETGKVNALLSVREFCKAKSNELGAIQRFETILEGLSDNFGGHLESVRTGLQAVYLDPSTFESNRPEIEASVQSAVASGVNAYQDLHKKHRLDKAGDSRKKAMVGSPQLKQLNRLVQVAALNGSKLEDLRNRINAVVSCPGATDADVLKSPTSLCPNCRFDPQSHPLETVAADLVQQCEDEIGEMHRSWTNQLLTELEDPSVQSSRKLMGADAQKLIEDFLSAKVLPAEISDAFITTMNDCFKGVKKKAVKASDFAKKIAGDGAPLKVEELRARFEAWLKEQVGSDDSNSVRFVLED